MISYTIVGSADNSELSDVGLPLPSLKTDVIRQESYFQAAISG